MTDQTKKIAEAFLSGDINGNHFSGEAFVQEMLTFAPAEYARLPAGTFEAHEFAIAILADRKDVQLLDVHGVSPAGIYDALYWRRTPAAEAHASNVMSELIQKSDCHLAPSEPPSRISVPSRAPISALG